MLWRLSLMALFALAGCGSDDEGGGSGGSSGGGGSGGSQGSTCADGYPKTGTPCAILYEKCTSCDQAWACCDVFECQAGTWAQTQFHAACPSDAGDDSPTEASTD